MKDFCWSEADLNYLAERILNGKRRELTLELALKCKTEKEKISFYEKLVNSLNDADDDSWLGNVDQFLAEYGIDDEEGELWGWLQGLTNKESEKEMINSLNNEYPNVAELIKNYKLFQFTSWFEDDLYKLSIEEDCTDIDLIERELQEVDPSLKTKLQKILELKRKENK